MGDDPTSRQNNSVDGRGEERAQCGVLVRDCPWLVGGRKGPKGTPGLSTREGGRTGGEEPARCQRPEPAIAVQMSPLNVPRSDAIFSRVLGNGTK